jgi:hypothetical protein
MKRAIMLLAVMLTGCVVLSTDAIVPADRPTLDPRFFGAWQEVNGTDHAVITRGDSGAYAIEYSSDCKAGRFAARLGPLGGRTVLDMWPTPGDKDIPDPYPSFMIPGHLMLVVELKGDELRVAALQPDTLGRALENGDVKLPFVRAKDQLILNGSTAQMRAALAPYLARAGALSEPTLFRREAAPSNGGVTVTPNAAGCGARSPAP